MISDFILIIIILNILILKWKNDNTAIRKFFEIIFFATFIISSQINIALLINLVFFRYNRKIVFIFSKGYKKACKLLSKYI